MRLSIVIFMFLMSGCVKWGKSVEIKNALDEHEVELLFTKDGCSVYRFFDIGDRKYFVDCAGRTMQTISCGKNCTRGEEIDTK